MKTTDVQAYKRPYEYLENGQRKVKLITLSICKCNNRRGPGGGVCGNCGNAIPEGTK